MRSLRARLFLAHVLLLAAALVALALLESRQQRDWLIARNRESLERLAIHLALDLDGAAAAPAADWQALAERHGASLGRRVTLIDSAGVVIGDSEVPRARLGALENHAGRPEVHAALAGGTGSAVRRSRSVGHDLLYVAVPARGPLPGGPAVVRVAEPLTEIARLNASLLRLSLAAAGITLAGMVVLLLWVTGQHASRIQELERAAARIGAGDAGARALEQPDDSLGRLGRAMNRMAHELRARLEALERERDTREAILAHMREGVALLDGTGRIIHMNHGFATIVGAARPAEPGTPFTDVARVPELAELVRHARRGGPPVETDLHLWSPQPRLVHAAATALDGAAGTVMLVLHDLTEIETVDRVRRDFVANVSHELRSPLTSLRGYAETLLEGGLDDVEHREGFARVIRDQAVRLETLVADLLALAELERPEARLRLERFDLRAAAERQLTTFRERARRAGLALELAAGPALEVEADRTRIEQAVANLLDNAIKYTERGGVTVRLGGDADHAWCEVADTGSGIPPADQPRIFERFYRVDKARSREKGGTGLGLSIAKHVIALHGGKLGVNSTPGEGSVFRFEIPRAASSGGGTAT